MSMVNSRSFLFVLVKYCICGFIHSLAFVQYIEFLLMLLHCCGFVL